MRERRVLVTGASSGIGEAIARASAEAGARVAVLARSEDRLRGLAEELDGVAVPADVTDGTALRDAVDRAADALGGLDGLVNAAGLALPNPMAEADPGEWRQMFDVNVLGLLEATQAALPYLREANVADVVNISSMSGRRRASVAMTVYSATKFAVHTISAGMREEFGPHGIRVSVISPGFVRTSIFDDDEHDDYREKMQEQGLDAEDVARLAVVAMAQPRDVAVVEIATSSMRQLN